MRKTPTQHGNHIQNWLLCCRSVLFALTFSSAPQQGRGDFLDVPLPIAPNIQQQQSPDSKTSAAPPNQSRSAEVPTPSPSGKNAQGPGATKSGALPEAQPLAPEASPMTPTQSTQPPRQSQGILSDDVTKHNNNAPITFNGRVVKGLRTSGQLDLEGDVEIVQADAKLLSDKATIFSVPGGNQMRKAIAQGNVKFTKQPTLTAPPLRAEAEEMEYLVPERKIVMTGKPKVWRGAELIQGKEITLDLDTGEVTIKEARGIVEPSKATKAQSERP